MSYGQRSKRPTFKRSLSKQVFLKNIAFPVAWPTVAAMSDGKLGRSDAPAVLVQAGERS